MNVIFPQDSSRNTTMFFGGMSENLFLTILQRLQELYGEITAGRADSHVATSSLSAKLEHLTALQRHLEESLREAQGQQTPGKNTSTNYTTYYYMRGEEGEGEGQDGGQRESTPKSSGIPKLSAMLDRQAEIDALRAELEEMKRWNEALQARLDESMRTRHVGVGMEKGAEEDAGATAAERSVSAEKYRELTREVDRLLEQLEAEKERSKSEKRQQQVSSEEIAQVGVAFRVILLALGTS